MSISSTLLASYLIKAGAPEREAKLISSQFGDHYLWIQSEKRTEGAGEKSKALAALQICDSARRDDFDIWELATDAKMFIQRVDIVASANICRAAIYSYAFSEKAAESIISEVQLFVTMANMRARSLGIPFDQQAVFEALKKSIEATAVTATAYRQKKGILSRIFG